MDLQHYGVVLMVESFCGRASPTHSRERERWRGSSWPAARVGVGGGCAPAPLIWGAGQLPWPLLQALGRRPKGEEWGASFPPSFWMVPLGFSLRAGLLGLRGLVHLAQSGQDTSP